MRVEGEITYWNHDKGYGFVQPDDGGDVAFVHVTCLADDIFEHVDRGARISFERVPGRQAGKLAAHSVELIKKA